MKRTCEHKNAVVRYLAGREAMQWKPWTNYAKRCANCGAWLSLGPSNDAAPEVVVEIAAARLLAGWWTGNDTDDTLDDPISRELLERWCGYGQGQITDAAEQCWHLHDVAIESGFLDGEGDE